MIRRILFSVIFVASATVLSLNSQTYSAYQSGKTNKQEVSKKESVFGFDKSKLTFGGGLGLQFGSYTMVSIAPQVGYNFSKIFNAGAGISYSFYKDDYYYGSQKWNEKRHYAGFNIYARVYPVEYIVLMVQPEATRMWQTLEPKGFGDKYSQNKFIPTVLVGGGLRLGSMTAMLQYDLVQDRNSPYGNNIFYSVGYTFGF